MDKKSAILAAIAAGKAIMEVYSQPDLGVEHKADDSPLTLADRRAHALIEERLKETGIPILSEEGRHLPYHERKLWEQFWLVDPLDGTREFIKRNGEFTVNIALVKGNQPVMGVVYAPAFDTLYWGIKGQGAWRLEDASRVLTDDSDILFSSGTPLPDRPLPEVYTMVGSRSHMNDSTRNHFAQLRVKHRQIEVMPMGSSLKICLVAEGKAHEYPRLGPTMEWDTAAGHAIAEAAGKKVVLHDNPDQTLQYNKQDLTNPWFVVY